MKACKTCSDLLPVAAFYKHKLTKDGLTSDCKMCCRQKSKQYKVNNPDKYKAGYLAYTLRNRDAINQRAREQRRLNPEKFREADRNLYERLRLRKLAQKATDYQRHRASRLEAVKRRYRDNPEPAKKRAQEWRERNPERSKAQSKRHYECNKAMYMANVKRRERRRRAVVRIYGQHTEQEWRLLLNACGGRCVHCGSSDRITRDHIVPLSKGGTDLINNIQPLCRRCNARKGAKLNYHPPRNSALAVDSLRTI